MSNIININEAVKPACSNCKQRYISNPEEKERCLKNGKTKLMGICNPTDYSPQVGYIIQR